ncbi:hydroxyisourate hydrolase [Nitratireductor sp. XY-223]|uniref:hydroxyisourate hydrolase n=1 Tax=Nitratireductor sp. XY-223 TaxID=2561926 RepID=UPI0010AA4E3B|nr:hydroxyisourate hydrolase [Nitratireductor sp. XY-223]
MAVVTSHVLNAVDGTHAGGVEATLYRCGEPDPVFATRTDAGGRLSQEIDLGTADPDTQYELVFATASYWAGRPEGAGRIPEIVLRFTMPDRNGTYHMPLILSPNAYTVWSSDG